MATAIRATKKNKPAIAMQELKFAVSEQKAKVFQAISTAYNLKQGG